MPTQVFSPEVDAALRAYQAAARKPTTKTVLVDGQPRTFTYPYPSPSDWRDQWIYFLMLDRFNNPLAPPASTQANPPSAWNEKYGFRQQGTFRGVQQQLGYLADLGAKAIWLSPVLKNPSPTQWEYNYHGYATQDFLNLDDRFASDGALATSEREFGELVDEAHARGLYIILDIVINHSARVFDYVIKGQTVDSFNDANVMNAPLGNEPAIEWLNGFGFPRADWVNNLPATPSPDDGVWPSELQRREFFRRRGAKLTDAAPRGSFARGDFGSMRQLVGEYDASVPGQEQLRQQYGKAPVQSILIRIYQYLMARYDIDGFRIDTVKYVDPNAVETFGNAIRELALSAGKRNFFTFGEVYDNEQTIANFVGRNSSSVDGFGIDAALDYPLFFTLPAAVKGNVGVESVRQVFEDRKAIERNLISSHGEAGKFFVSFLDNHDQQQRFSHPQTPAEQVTMGLALLFSLQGIPCVYYGTEQGLEGTKDGNGNPILDSNESVREALWGKTPNPFDAGAPLYTQIKALSDLRDNEPALRYGRLYFRELSGNGQDFGHSQGQGGVIAFSRVLNDREIVIVANTSYGATFSGYVLLDLDLNRTPRNMSVAYSNLGSAGAASSQLIDAARVFENGNLSSVGPAAALFIKLAPMETQVIVPDIL